MQGARSCVTAIVLPALASPSAAVFVRFELVVNRFAQPERRRELLYARPSASQREQARRPDDGSPVDTYGHLNPL
jgi:hypothetical protein